MVIQKRKISQNAIIMLCWALYTIASIGKYSYSANINLIMSDYGVSHADAGLVSTFFFFAYAGGQFLNSFLVKYYNKKKMIPVVLVSLAFLEILLFLHIPFAAVKYVWLLMGLMQSCLWPLVVDSLGENLDKRHRDRGVMILGTTNTAGVLVVYLCSAMFVKMGVFRCMFLLSSVAMAAMAIVWYAFYNPTGVSEEKESTVENQRGNNGFEGIISLIIVLTIFAVVDNLVRDGLNTWFPAILKEKYKMSDEMSIILSLVLPVFGMIGAVTSVYLKKITKNFTLLLMIMMLAGAALMAVPAFFGGSGIVLILLCFGLALFLAHSANNVLVSIVPLEMKDKVNSGSLAALLNGFCYIGSTMSSYGLGVIADKNQDGWHMVFLTLIMACVFSAIAGMIYLISCKLIKKS